MWPIFDWLLGGGPKAVGEGMKAVADGATGVIGTIWGDEAEEQRQLSAEQIALMQQFAGEFVARTQRTPWDSFVDGLNRLPRPLMTFGMILLLGWACVDPPGFAIVMGALASVPEPLWAVWGAMVAFWLAPASCTGSATGSSTRRFSAPRPRPGGRLRRPSHPLRS